VARRTVTQSMRLILGTAQIGLAYGTAIRRPMMSEAAAADLLSSAHASGFEGLDTARAYGESERRIGVHLGTRGGFAIGDVVTKLSPLAGLTEDADAASLVARSLEESCEALGTDRLETVLLHRAEHFHVNRGAVWNALRAARDSGLVSRLGVSVQGPDELLDALDRPDVAHIQLPANILDHRWDAAWERVPAARREGLTVDVRSVFLQGVLASPRLEHWPAIPGLDPGRTIAWLQATADGLGLATVTALCMSFIASMPWVSRLVVGADTVGQVQELAACRRIRRLTPAEVEGIVRSRPEIPPSLLNPALWPK
jgi:aryl-alcohol dehydrogenase-like predicted oxidoreductase